MERNGRRLWQADWSDAAGRRCRRVLGASKRAAERALCRIISERDLELSGHSPAAPDVSLEEVCARYLTRLRAKAKPRTVHDAGVALDRLRAFLRVRTLRALSKVRIVEYRDQRLARDGVSHKTVNTEVATLQAALNYAHNIGLAGPNPLSGLPSLPTTEEFRVRVPRSISDGERARIIHACEVRDRARGGVPRAPLLRFLDATGARYGETVALTWIDLDAQARTVTLRATTTKNKRTRVLPLTADLVAILLSQRPTQEAALGRAIRREDGVFLTPMGSRWPRNSSRFRVFFYSLMDAAGVERRDAHGRLVTLHALRHTFATRLARNKVPIQQAAKLTGHRTISMLVEVYNQLDIEDARNAIEGLPPLPDIGSL